MKALRVDRSTGRFMLARLVSGIDTGTAAKIGPLTLTNCEPPALVNNEWQRVHPLLTGICGRDRRTFTAWRGGRRGVNHHRSCESGGR